MKICSKCGKTVQRENLKFIGIQKSHGAANYDLDLYNCDCGTTLCFKVFHTPKTAEEMINQLISVCDDILKNK